MIPTIACVLKSGGDFTPKDVKRLKSQIFKYVTPPFKFICLTDVPELFDFPCNTRRLRGGYKGWWSKVEVFALQDFTIYFDLDTIVLQNLDGFVNRIYKEIPFVSMLQAFKAGETHASGIMAWQGNYSFILNEFNPEIHESYSWDQRYIVAKLEEHNRVINTIDRKENNIISYKRDVIVNRAKLNDAAIVCFHGEPRPSQVEPFWSEEDDEPIREC